STYPRTPRSALPSRLASPSQDDARRSRGGGKTSPRRPVRRLLRWSGRALAQRTLVRLARPSPPALHPPHRTTLVVLAEEGRPRRGVLCGGCCVGRVGHSLNVPSYASLGPPLPPYIPLTGRRSSFSRRREDLA